MNLFENFDVTDLTFRKPPADNSLTTFKELQELNNLKLDKDFVVQKDNIIDNFEKINSAAGLDFPKNEITKLQNDSTSVIKNLNSASGIILYVMSLPSRHDPLYLCGGLLAQFF